MKTVRGAAHMRSRRRILKMIAGAGAVAGTGRAVPDRWTQPIVDAVLLPAHAQSTLLPACSTTPLALLGEVSWEDNGGDRVTLSINPGFDGAAGSALLDQSGNFSGSLAASGGECANGQPVTQDGTFQGNLNTSNGAVSGSFTHRILCGGVVICTSSGNFSGTAVFDTQQTVTVSSVASECCPDATAVFGP